MTLPASARGFAAFLMLAASAACAVHPQAATASAPDAAILAPHPDDDGPYVRYTDAGVEARWVCDGTVTTETLAVATWPVTLPARCGVERPLPLRGRAPLDTPSRITGVRRLAALSDVHGQYALTRRLLQANGIVDANADWAYGDGHLVIAGDVFDRGPQVNELLWLVYGLEAQARAAGGAVHLLLGNHESLVLRDDLRYIHDRYRRNSTRLGTPYPALYGPDTVLGDWLRSKRTVLQVDELLFVHGGLGPAYFALGLGLDETNARSRSSLGLSRVQLRTDPVLEAMQDGADSPIWYRGYFFDAAMTAERIDTMLAALGVERLVVGHTSQPNVQSRFGGRVIAIDSSIKEGESGELLFREDGVLSRGLLDGRRVPVEPGETPPDELLAETVNTQLRRAPVFDGRSGFAAVYAAARPAWSLDELDFAAAMPGQVDVPRLRAGRVGANVVMLDPVDGTPLPQVMAAFDWLDALVAKHPQHLARVEDTAALEQARAEGRIALVPALADGGVLAGDVAALDELHARGLRVLGLVRGRDNALGRGASTSPDAARPDGLTGFGREVVAAMNRLGIVVDLTGADVQTARDAVALSRTPVLLGDTGGLPDDVLRAVASQGGVVLVPADPARVAAATPTVAIIADRIEHIARVAGDGAVGIGSGFDGMGDRRIAGLEDVSRLPAVFVELSRRGWTEDRLAGLARGNLLRVWARVEAIAAHVPPKIVEAR